MFDIVTGFFTRKIVTGLAITAVVGSCFWYYNWSQREIRTLRDNASLYETAIDGQKLTIESLQRDITKQRDINRLLNRRNAEYQQQLRDLERKFEKNQRDLGDIAKNKPGLTEDIINEATKRAKECMEQLSRGEEPTSCD